MEETFYDKFLQYLKETSGNSSIYEILYGVPALETEVVDEELP